MVNNAREQLAALLPRVQKPARYSGGEFGEIIKDRSAVSLRIALAFPDTYEIGMSNLGCRILYGAANAVPRFWCERVFAPWFDMAAEMRRGNIPLFALESGDPVSEFDVAAFSLGYEMAYTTVLDMLDLAGIPLRSDARQPLTPLIIAGGTCAFNPEPLADFIDLFVVGEGEEVNLELYAALESAKSAGLSKTEFLRSAANIPGVYVPGLYETAYNEDGTVAAINATCGAPLPVVKRVVSDFGAAYFPTAPVVPSTEIVHDRVSVEVMRGCLRGCRFCQAGYAYRPARERPPEILAEQVKASVQATGYDEVTLLSLSTSDYGGLLPLCDALIEYCEPRRVSLSLPSLRADNFSVELQARVQKVRKTGLTFAPEAGTQRLRDVINKNVTEQDVLNTAKTAFGGGFSTIKLYFMLGLPTETDDDVLGIADLANKVAAVWRESPGRSRKPLRLTVSTSMFVPKPHTAFQWEPQLSRTEYSRRTELLRANLRSKLITYNWHAPDTSLAEAVLSRGDRRLGAVIERVYRDGGRLEAWDEGFSLKRWTDALAASGLTAEFYAGRERADDELFPWSVASTGVSGEFLRRERDKSRLAQTTPHCREECSNCGANSLCRDGVCYE
ncbi:MAG: TIGR03960 family B12-binding radical SAM protein [Oscillospiraceae bacterium]|jgi:radical SAM family uncharacterized protein|nr:TIGR03960 family B12-binding radical SAM protein [Oscillospiraceae bacterium]